VKLRYTFRGAAELDRTLAHIAEQSPQGGRRVQKRIHAVIDLLLQHPDAGRFTTKRRLRRISTFPYPYLIFYRATETRS
jgi:toxin ParE1/3/4